jgi:hypothetical protein
MVTGSGHDGVAMATMSAIDPDAEDKEGAGVPLSAPG